MFVYIAFILLFWWDSELFIDAKPELDDAYDWIDVDFRRFWELCWLKHGNGQKKQKIEDG